MGKAQRELNEFVNGLSMVPESKAFAEKVRELTAAAIKEATGGEMFRLHVMDNGVQLLTEKGFSDQDEYTIVYTFYSDSVRFVQTFGYNTKKGRDTEWEKGVNMESVAMLYNSLTEN